MEQFWLLPACKTITVHKVEEAMATAMNWITWKKRPSMRKSSVKSLNTSWPSWKAMPIVPRLLGLPTKLAPQLEGKTKEQIYVRLTREIEEKLSELSEYSPDLFTDEEVVDDDDA